MNAGIGCYINVCANCYVHIVFNAISIHTAQMLYPCTCTRFSIHACIECYVGAWIGCGVNAYVGCYVYAYILDAAFVHAFHAIFMPCECMCLDDIFIHIVSWYIIVK